MNREQFLTTLSEVRAIAVLRTPHGESARGAMEAALRGGFRIAEFTLNTPGALDLIEEFSARPDLIVGAGTVLSAEEANTALDRGASYLVSPVADEDVIGVALSRGVAVIPGTFTATEMLRAHRAGAPLQKLFPAPGVGPAYVKAMLGPMPFLRIVPTHGVDAENAAAYLQAGAFALGFVSPLFDPEDVAAGRFQRIEERARELLRAMG
ncbi:MAG: bifunctional 4-hydroxy-2-oxoglutarate aldolase/2-dehydro-3-deoxy-phosphogluconate aldolase [Planctomycetota bacterium]